MKSKTSCFNSGIAKNLLSRCWPLWLGYLLILLLVPLTLYSRLRSFDPGTELSPALDLTLGATFQPIVLLSFLISIFTAMAVFGFLYNTRSCGLMNSLPVTRTSLFFTCFLTGYLALLAADVLACDVTALLCLSGYMKARSVLVFFAVLVFSKTFLYGFAAFCAMLTGSLLILPCVYFVLNFTAIIAEACAKDILSKIVYGLSGNGFHLVFLSPLVYMLSSLGVCYTEWPSNVEFTGIPATAVYALVGIVFMLFAWRLFLRRRMETAGDTVAIRVLKPVFQYCMCFGSAVVFAALVYEIADLRLSGRGAALVLLALLLVGAFLGYFAARMLIEKSFRVFRKNAKGFLICALVIVLLFTACEFDLFGVEKRVPSAGTVEQVVINGVELKEADSIENVLAFHSSMIANQAKHEAQPRQGNEYLYVNDGGMELARNAEITYILKNGKILTRFYRVRADGEDVTDPDSDLRKLEAILNLREALEYRCTFDYPLKAENVVSASIQFSPVFGDQNQNYYISVPSYTLSGEEFLDFWENGVLPDLAEGHIARRVICDYDRGWCYTNADLFLCLTEDREAYQRSGGSISQQQWVDLEIATDSAHCLDWIEKHAGIRPVSIDSGYPVDYYGVG